MSFWVDGKQSALAATRVGGYGKLPADTHPSGGCSRHLAECPAGRRIGAGGTVQNLPFGGTAVLIMIGVGLDTVKQIESQLMQRNYEGFLK